MKRYNITPSGYKFDKLIIYSAILVLLCSLAYLVSSYGLKSYPYTECNSIKCENPFFNRSIKCDGIMCNFMVNECLEDWCYQEFLTEGKYGQEPPFITRNFFLISLMVLALALILNHVIHNKNNKFSLDTKRKILPDCMAYLVKKAYPKYQNEVDFAKIKLEEEK